MTYNGVSWAAEVEAAETTTVKKAGGKQLSRGDEKLQLPEIPALFDPDTYDPPEPIIIKRSDNTYTRVSWKIDVDPKAGQDVECPDMVCFQIIENFRTETQRVNKRVAARRHFKKYGMSEHDGHGPNAQTTNMQNDDIPIVFLNRRHAQQKPDDDKYTLSQEEEEELKKMRQQILSQLQLHNLTGANMGQGRARIAGGEAGPDASGGAANSFSALVASRRRGPGGADGPGGAMPERPGRPTMNRMDDEGCGVRVTNLSENITDGDIQDLFGKCGRIKRVYLARDKRTGKAKGFAYVTYDRQCDAEKAIRMLNKYTYDYLVLSVEWSKTDKDKK